MKAALLTRYNAPLTIAEVGLTPLRYGQVLVRVLASGICGAQLQEIRGEKKGGTLPHLLGHEGCGIVEEIGPGVTRVAPGQKVVMHWRKAAGIEAEFPRYVYKKEEITSGKVTTFSEKSICSENRLTPVPDDTPPELCALLGCGLSTALAIIESEATVKFGESVLIIGCGGLGANLIRAASMRKAHPICVLELHEHKSQLAHQCGCNDFFAIRGGDWRQLAVMQKRSFDVIIDTAGNSTTMEQALPYLSDRGRYIMVGQPKPGESVQITDARHLFQGEGKTIKATQGGGFRPDLDIPRYVALHTAGLLDLDHIITHVFSLEKINSAIDAVRAGEAGRILIEMSPVSEMKKAA